MQEEQHQYQKEEKLKLILQYLKQGNFVKSFDCLQQQSKITLDEHCLQNILTIDYQQVEKLLDKYVDIKTKNKCMLLILEQRYIQYIINGESENAIKLLRNQITQFCEDESQKHYFAKLIFSKELETKSDQQIMESIIQLCYKEIGLLEPQRLTTLIQQAKANQILNCQWHKQLEQKYSIQKQHYCDKDFHYVIKKGINDDITKCVFSQNAEYQAQICQGEYILLFEYDSKKENYTFLDKISSMHKKKITHIEFSPCSKYFGTSSEDCLIVIYNIKTKKKIKLEGHNNIVQSFCFVQYNNQKLQMKKSDYLIYSISVDGWLYEWQDTERRGGLKIEETIKNMHICQQQNLMLLVSQNKISLYEIYSKNLIQSQVIGNYEIKDSLVDKQFKLIFLDVSENYPEILMFNIATLQMINAFVSYDFITNQPLVLDNGWFNGNLLVAGTQEGQLIIWHIQKSSLPIDTLSIQVSDQQKIISSIKFHPLQQVLYIHFQVQGQVQKNQSEESSQQQSRYQFPIERGSVQQILHLLQRIARSSPGNSNRQRRGEENLSDDDL